MEIRVEYFIKNGKYFRAIRENNKGMKLISLYEISKEEYQMLTNSSKEKIWI